MTYGFVGMLLKLLRDYKPDYLAVVIDVSGDRESFRSQLLPTYKANREEMPDDLRPQISRCVDLLKQINIPVLGQEGVEADDVIATLVRRIEREHPDLEIRIVSRDKDLAQLLDKHIHMFDVHKDEQVTAADVFKYEGVEPRHVVDMLALMGDNVDNIPGVPGIGPKTAAHLITTYGTIENLYDHIEEIKGKRRENLEAHHDTVLLNRQLVQLHDDLEVDFDLENALGDPGGLPADTFKNLLRELGFGRYVDELQQLLMGIAVQSGTLQSISPSSDAIANTLFEQESVVASSAPRAAGTYSAITTKKQLEKLVAKLRETMQCALDTETTSIQAVQADVCGLCIAVEPEEAWYIPTRSPEPQTHLDTQTVLDALRPLLENPTFQITGHNLKYDLNVLRRAGIDVRATLFDTMIASYVVDATRSSHSMDVLALALLNHTCIPISELIGKGKNQKRFDEVPLAQAIEYAAEDADITLRLRDALEPQLDALELRALFDDVEMPLVKVLAELEYNGIHLDPDELDRQRLNLNGRIDDLRQRISAAAPHAFNPDSPKQLAAALFNTPDDDPPGLGLRVTKRGKTGPSTDVEVLERLAADPDVTTEVPQLIVEYRQLTKLVNTYLLALKDAINPETRRVHASFNQTVAATGRLSSSDPNLQNIPIRTDVGREIRRAFVAEAGNILITADYSQIELRLLAHLSQDPALIDAFQRGADIHTEVAAEVFDVSPDDVTSAQRNSAKMVNFGIVYGITPYGLARRLGPDSSVEQATQIIDEYNKRFAKISEFLQQCVDHAHTHGYVETILKRRRAIPQITSKQPRLRSLGERMAINTVVQGSAADLIKLAMIDLYAQLPMEHSHVRMLLQIHDELVFEAPHSDADAVAEYVKQHMETAMDLTVPLVVSAAWSESWVDVK